jgi:hypothetical protein
VKLLQVICNTEVPDWYLQMTETTTLTRAPILIVTINEGIVKQWEGEFEKFSTGFNVVAITESKVRYLKQSQTQLTLLPCSKSHK